MPELNRYEPSLLCMGIIASPLDAVRMGLQRKLEETIGNDSYKSKLESINWKVFFERNGLFYDMLRFQIALFSPRDDLTVYVCNLADGWVSLYRNIIKAEKFDAYFFRVMLQKNAMYKVFDMSAWQNGALNRHVRTLQEERGWEFLNEGDPLPFEDVERYWRRKISDRLDRDLIERYSEAAGFGVERVTQFENPCWHFCRGQ